MMDEQLDEIQDPTLLVHLLLEQRETLSPKLRERILSMGSPCVPSLLEMLNNEHVQMEDAPGGGWASIHATVLLGELRAEEAIPSMLTWLLRTESGEDILHSRLISTLSAFGETAFQPVLQAYHETSDPEYRRSLCDTLTGLGIKDDQIFDIALDYLEEDVEYGAMCFAVYGDSKALVHLQRALDDYEVEETDNPFAYQPVIELCGAIQELGGQLTPSQAEKHKRVMAHRARYSDQIDAVFNPLSKGGLEKEIMEENQSPEFTPEARSRWEKVPSWAQLKILESVWCVNCRQGVPMELGKGRMEETCLILEGTCKRCGDKVVRLLEPEE